MTTNEAFDPVYRYYETGFFAENAEDGKDKQLTYRCRLCIAMNKPEKKLQIKLLF